MSVHFHVLSRQEARHAVGDRVLRPVAIVSISGSEPPPRELRDLGVPLLGLQMDDVTRDIPAHGYFAPTREHVDALLSWWWANRPVEGDVIVHCAAGISRSSACVLTLMAAEYGEPRSREHARMCVLDLLAGVYDTHQQGLRNDAGIRPNTRIVWLADQVLGWNGHLLAAVEHAFAMRGIWVDLGEEPPANWPGKTA